MQDPTDARIPEPVRSDISRFALLVTLAAGLLCGACGTADPAAGTDAAVPREDAGPIECPIDGSRFPLAIGASWTYRVVDLGNGEVTAKTQTVEAFEDVGGSHAGTMAFRLRTEKPTGYTVSWQEQAGDLIMRHRELDMGGATQTEEFYEPYKLRLDETAEHTVVGASWTVAYTEIVTDMATGITTSVDKTEEWFVEAVDEVVTVAAGTFCTLRVRRQSTALTGGSNKTYWWARGVGKIREEGANQTEELTGYVIP